MKNLILVSLLFFVGIPAQAGWHANQEITEDIYSFGKSVDALGQYMVIGAPQEESGNGAVYIYIKEDGAKEWSLLQKIEMPAPNPAPTIAWRFKGFGKDVALTGLLTSLWNRETEYLNNPTLVIGAPNTEMLYTLGGNTYTTQFDALLVYDYNATSKQFQFSTFFREEDNSGAGNDVDAAMIMKRSGSVNVAIITPVGKIIVTGMPAKDMLKAYVQDLDSGDWEDFNITANPQGNHFGESVAVGTIYVGDNVDKFPNAAVAGTPDIDLARGGLLYHDRGAISVIRVEEESSGHYSFKGSQTLQQPIPEPSAEIDIQEYTYFGKAVSINYEGDRIIAGASREGVTPAGEIPSGEARAYQYNRDQNRWDPLGDAFRVPVPRDAFDGTYVQAVDIRYDTAVIGMPSMRLKDVPCSMDGGAAIFEFAGDNWLNTGMHLGKSEASYGIGSAVSIQNKQEMLIGSSYGKKVIEMRKHSSALPAIIEYLLD